MNTKKITLRSVVALVACIAGDSAVPVTASQALQYGGGLVATGYGIQQGSKYLREVVSSNGESTETLCQKIHGQIVDGKCATEEGGTGLANK